MKRLRKKNGWTQAELAKRIGISRTAISDLENGVKTSLNKNQKAGLEKLLGIAIEELLNDGGQ
ncbi:helix-turn-helix transcriptional regulator [Pelorhabdus rhamnosifermentans]|uniref:helix-turn-helix transcriptional regulator n=1 Tax=Pelorhabdus rhamnosifermentans TaxID=2772457 RepID=UPI0035E3F9E2